MGKNDEVFLHVSFTGASQRVETQVISSSQVPGLPTATADACKALAGRAWGIEPQVLEIDKPNGLCYHPIGSGSDSTVGKWTLQQVMDVYGTVASKREAARKGSLVCVFKIRKGGTQPGVPSQGLRRFGDEVDGTQSPDLPPLPSTQEEEFPLEQRRTGQPPSDQPPAVAPYRPATAPHLTEQSHARQPASKQASAAQYAAKQPATDPHLPEQLPTQQPVDGQPSEAPARTAQVATQPMASQQATTTSLPPVLGKRGLADLPEQGRSKRARVEDIGGRGKPRGDGQGNGEMRDWSVNGYVVDERGLIEHPTYGRCRPEWLEIVERRRWRRKAGGNHKPRNGKGAGDRVQGDMDSGCEAQAKGTVEGQTVAGYALNKWGLIDHPQYGQCRPEWLRVVNLIRPPAKRDTSTYSDNDVIILDSESDHDREKGGASGLGGPTGAVLRSAHKGASPGGHDTSAKGKQALLGRGGQPSQQGGLAVLAEDAPVGILRPLRVGDNATTRDSTGDASARKLGSSQDPPRGVAGGKQNVRGVQGPPGEQHQASPRGGDIGGNHRARGLQQESLVASGLTFQKWGGGELAQGSVGPAAGQLTATQDADCAQGRCDSPAGAAGPSGSRLQPQAHAGHQQTPDGYTGVLPPQNISSPPHAEPGVGNKRLRAGGDNPSSRAAGELWGKAGAHPRKVLRSNRPDHHAARADESQVRGGS